MWTEIIASSDISIYYKQLSQKNINPYGGIGWGGKIVVRIIHRLMVLVVTFLCIFSFSKVSAAIEYTYIGEGVNYLYITSQYGYNVCLDNSSTFYQEDTDIRNKKVWYVKTYSGNLVWLDNKMNVVKTVPIKALEIVSRIFRKIFYYHLIVEYYPTVTSA